MFQKEKIVEVLYEVIEEMNQTREKEEQLTKSLGTIIFGKDGKLDSLGLVNFIVAVEEKISELFNKNITLADERALSLENSPFQNVSTISDYILKLLNE